MTNNGPLIIRSSPKLPDRAAIATDRVERLRARIANGAYPVRANLIAEAILACDEDDGSCGSVRAIQLTPAMDQASND
jgi:hypothetical protein